MNEYLFSYGTLQKEEVQLDLFGRLLTGWKDIVKGYKIFSIEIKDESFLSRGEQKSQMTARISDNKNDLIEGTILEVSEVELAHVDKYEPDEYKRFRVKLESGKEAWIYMAAK